MRKKRNQQQIRVGSARAANKVRLNEALPGATFGRRIPTSTTFVFDIETSGLRAGLGTREQVGARGARYPSTPPRITQFALSRVDKAGQASPITIIGGGKDRGYTSVIQDLAQKHGVVSPQDLPKSFLDELEVIPSHASGLDPG